MSVSVHDGVLYGADDVVARMVTSALGLPGFTTFTALGVMRGDKLTGGVVYHNWRGHDIEVTAAIAGGAWARDWVLRRLFDYPFRHCGCSRMTAVTAASNERVKRILRRFGFEQEGFHPRGGNRGEDAVSFGMLVENCPWIDRRVS